MNKQYESRASIVVKLDHILNSFFGEENQEKSLTREDKLRIVTSESVQALAFVATVEDEFELEFEDDEIDLEFLFDFETIVTRVDLHIHHPKNDLIG